MVRIIFMLIAVYNVFIMLKSWALASFYLSKIFPSSLSIVNTLIFVAFMLFIFIHSIRLIMFRKSSIIIQNVICVLDPIVRIITTILLIKAPPQAPINIFPIVMLQSIYIFIDIVIVFFIRSNKVKDIVGHAEIWKEEKYRRKLMEKNIGKIS